MLGAGLCDADLTRRKMADVLPENVHWTKQYVARIDASKNEVHTQGGEVFTYEHLVVGSGLKYDWEKIKGAKEALNDPKSNVGTIYQLQYAEKTRDLGRKFKGGKAIFT